MTAPAFRARLAAARLRADERARVAVRDRLRALRQRGLAVPSRAPAGPRGRIIVLDMQVPRTDRNAGDRNIVDFMRTLGEAGWTVSYYPRDLRDDPLYSEPLRAIGVDVVAGPARPTLASWLRVHRDELRHALVCRPTVAAAYLSVIRRHADVPITYYGHDLHFARMRMEAEVLGRANVAADAARIEALERWCWRRADVVIYPSAEEATTVSERCPGTIACSVPIFRFDAFTPRAAMPAAKQVLFVGGFSHSPNIDAATWLALEIWPAVRQLEPEAQLRLVGANPPDEVRALAGEGIAIPGAVSHEALTALYANSRVAAVPLRIGAGMKLKVVESLALGVPLVTTSVGAQGLPGLDAVDDPQAFAAETARLLRLDAAQWLEQSSRQIAYAAERFGEAAMRDALEEVLAQAGERHAERGK